MHVWAQEALEFWQKQLEASAEGSPAKNSAKLRVTVLQAVLKDHATEDRVVERATWNPINERIGEFASDMASPQIPDGLRKAVTGIFIDSFMRGLRERKKKKA